MDTPPIERRSTDSVRDRTQSFEEQLVQSTEGEEGGANRSEILSRISKMGQSMLPVPAAVTSSTSEPAPISQVRTCTCICICMSLIIHLLGHACHCSGDYCSATSSSCCTTSRATSSPAHCSSPAHRSSTSHHSTSRVPTASHD